MVKYLRLIYKQTWQKCIILTGVCALCSCNHLSNLANPFYEPPKPIALLGDKNDHALNEGKEKEDSARAALDAVATYQRAHSPQPVYPVVQPAVVRLMWIPDHLNQHGDLVPAHFYYLKVLGDRWAVQDAFELEGQLKGPGGVGGDANLPFMYGNEKVQQ